MALKGIVKGRRFPRLASIGDVVAMKFVLANRQDLQDAIDRIRDVMASRPGCVSDQDSTLDFRGDTLDPEKYERKSQLPCNEVQHALCR